MKATRKQFEDWLKSQTPEREFDNGNSSICMGTCFFRESGDFKISRLSLGEISERFDLPFATIGRANWFMDLIFKFTTGKATAKQLLEKLNEIA